MNNVSGMVGESVAMKALLAQTSLVSATNTTVLIMGETGTGKELIAHAIHQVSCRSSRPMISLNCGAVSNHLLESELFGHEKGSFTGAFERRLGKFELANKSTLFLDEIGELPLQLQSRLLRVLQSHEIERIGSSTTIKVDVRIIAATNRNLYDDVEKGRFRMDLFYRLNVFPLVLPPLRERIGDIPLLCSHFIQLYTGMYGKQEIKGISTKVLTILSYHTWPGNIRELEHTIQRAILMCNGDMIEEVFIAGNNEKFNSGFDNCSCIKTIDENEREHIIHVLQLCKGRISGRNGAAKLLGVPSTTLNSKIKRLGISKGFSFE